MNTLTNPQSNEIKLDILTFDPSESNSGSFDLTLREVAGSRSFQFAIGMFETQAIVIVLEKVVPNRPMTHDLFKLLAEQLNFTVEKILLCDYQQPIFYAKIIGSTGAGGFSLDARPSDAIAIGIRFNAPIYIDESILNKVSFK